MLPALVRQALSAWLLVIILGLATVAMLVPYVFWSLADMSAPMEEATAPLAFNGAAEMPATWRAEEWVYVWRYIQVRRSLPCLARRMLVNNAIIVRLPDIWEPLQFEHDGRLPIHTSTFQIPASVAPGLYQYQVTLDCEINPLKQITARLRDVPIYVETNPVLETIEDRTQALKRELEQLDKYVKPQPHTRVPGPASKELKTDQRRRPQ